MDPIPPIGPQPPAVGARPPVQRLERVSRERDRLGYDAQRRRRREQAAREREQQDPDEPDDDGRPHVDVIA